MDYLQVLTCLALALSYGIAADEDSQDIQSMCEKPIRSLYPSVVSLAYRRDKQHSHTCVGTLLSRSNILTTASCFKNKSDLKKWQVRAGSQCSSYGGQLRNVVNITTHPPTKSDVLSDLAIIQMSTALDPDANVKPARLPDKDVDPLTTEQPTIVGWGGDKTEVPTEYMNFVGVELVDAESCAIRMNKSWGMQTGVICTTEHNGHSSTPCPGDMGGPVLADEDMILGVIARIPANCGTVGTEDAYVDIATYRDWIASVAGLS